MDRAADYTDNWLESILASSRQTKPTAASVLTCLDCMDPIPEGRRVAAPGCVRCLECEGYHQREASRHA